jgi:ribosomal protein S28E/S33
MEFVIGVFMVLVLVTVMHGGVGIVRSVLKGGNRNRTVKRTVKQPVTYARLAMLVKTAKIVPRAILARIVQSVLLGGNPGFINPLYFRTPFQPMMVGIFVMNVFQTILGTIVHDAHMVTMYHK